MAQAITTLQTVLLNTTLSGGIQPYDPCTTWVGSYTAGNGSTGAIPVNFQAVGTPYIQSSNCVSGNGALTGAFYPNGFTGDVGLWVYAKDASGIADESNHLEYTVILQNTFNVSAGPDVTTNSTSYTLAGAISGGVLPHTAVWSVVSQPTGSALVEFVPDEFQLNAEATSLDTNGFYTFRLNGADSGGQTGTDTMKVKVQGQAPPFIPFSIYWTNEVVATLSNRTSKLTIEHQPLGSAVWNTALPQNIRTGVGVNSGSFTLNLASANADKIRVSLTGVNTYKNIVVQGEDGYLSYATIPTAYTDSTAQLPNKEYTVYSGLYNYYTVDGSTTQLVYCLVAGSLVNTADGNKVKVEDLQVHDYLASADIPVTNNWSYYESSEFEFKPISTKITAIKPAQVSSYIKINDDIKITAAHPLFILREGVYKFSEAKDIVSTDKLISESGDLVDITSVQLIQENVNVYAISTNPSHIYIANGVINHNVKKDIFDNSFTGTFAP
jgi:hypothetical protein